QSAIGPHQELSVPGRFFPRPPAGQGCVNACPQVAAPGPRLANASGRRPSNLDRDSGSIITLSVKSIAISLTVNDGGCLTHNERNTNEIKLTSMYMDDQKRLCGSTQRSAGRPARRSSARRLAKQASQLLGERM